MRHLKQAAGALPLPRSGTIPDRLYGKERNLSGEYFWARGYAVSIVGFELEQVRQYIREQDAADGTVG